MLLVLAELLINKISHYVRRVPYLVVVLVYFTSVTIYQLSQNQNGNPGIKFSFRIRTLYLTIKQLFRLEMINKLMYKN